LKNTWFNLANDANFWLKWDVSDEDYEELMAIYYQLYKTDENVWELLIDSVKYFASHNDNYHHMPAYYKHYCKQFVNKCFNFIVDNCDSEDDWLVALDKFYSIQFAYNSSISRSSTNLVGGLFLFGLFHKRCSHSILFYLVLLSIMNNQTLLPF
jgi:hypothetical protein